MWQITEYLHVLPSPPAAQVAGCRVQVQWIWEWMASEAFHYTGFTSFLSSPSTRWWTLPMEPTFISITSEIHIYAGFFYLIYYYRQYVDSLGGSKERQENTHVLDIWGASHVMLLVQPLPCWSNEVIATHRKKDACITSQQHTDFPLVGIEHSKTENSGFLSFFKRWNSFVSRNQS